MGMKLLRFVQGKRRVAIDTCLYIYLFGEKTKYTTQVKELFRFLEAQETKLIISTLLLTELFVDPIQHNDAQTVERWWKYFHSSLVELLPVTPDIALAAASLRAKYHLKTPDSILLATALDAHAEAFLGNDKKLRKIIEIPVFCIDQ